MKVTWFDASTDFPTWQPAVLEKNKLKFVSGGAEAPYLIPAFVDTHIHGIAGFDVMEGEIEAVRERLLTIGVEWFFPTTISSSWEEINNALSSVCIGEGIAGVHLEGPFLNPERAGAHPKHALREIDSQDFFSSMGKHIEKIKIITLAPELRGALDFIRELTSLGIYVSGGHTNASFEVLLKAKEVGLKQITHLFNAMSPFSHREPGCVGFGLIEEVACELIYDRVHVSREAAEIFFRCKSPSLRVAISDGTKLSQTKEGTQMEMWGKKVTHADGVVRDDSGILCGSACTMADVFRNLWQDFPSRRLEVVAMCSMTARRIFRLPEPKMWLMIDEEGNIHNVIKGDFTVED